MSLKVCPLKGECWARPGQDGLGKHWVVLVQKRQQVKCCSLDGPRDSESNPGVGCVGSNGTLLSLGEVCSGPDQTNESELRNEFGLVLRGLKNSRGNLWRKGIISFGAECVCARQH